MKALEYKLKKTENESYLLIIEEEDIEYSNSRKLHSVFQQIFDKECQHLEVDFSHIKMIDSSGMGLIIFYHEKFVKDNREFIIKNVNEQVMELFRLVNIDKMLGL